MNEMNRLGDTGDDIDITKDFPFEKSYARYRMGGMTKENRAKQFAPYAALKGFDDEVKAEEVEISYYERNDEFEEIDNY